MKMYDRNSLTSAFKIKIECKTSCSFVVKQQNYFSQWKEQKETYSVQSKRAFNLKSSDFFTQQMVFQITKAA